METERHPVSEMTIEEFAENNNLIMEIHERNDPKLPKHYAHFKLSDIKEGSCLIGKFGDGETEQEAIRNYAKEISGQLLVIGAFSNNRRNIQVPRLIEKR
jgi:hypothetical protein